MARPILEPVLSAVTSSNASSPVASKGHPHITLFVEANNVDTNNDAFEVRLEGSPDGNTWAPVEMVSGNKAVIDVNSIDTDTAAVSVNGGVYEYLRANVVSVSDSANGDLSLNVWIMAAGNSGTGRRGASHGSP